METVAAYLQIGMPAGWQPYGPNRTWGCCANPQGDGVPEDRPRFEEYSLKTPYRVLNTIYNSKDTLDISQHFLQHGTLLG